ncbi:MAG: NAD(P)-binding domain-containing protein, partial [Candidatus Marinimicrobia bacterium]|nr:NAD(P)-binding domain-containing protein [Candidatus Neomarinimicrobiota bacterium]
MKRKKIGMIGTGSWGTAMGLHLYDLGHIISYWEFDKERVTRIQETRINDLIPFRKFPKDVKISHDLKDVVFDKDILIFAIPSHAMRQTCKEINKFAVDNNPVLINISKGIEITSLMRMSEVI